MNKEKKADYIKQKIIKKAAMNPINHKHRRADDLKNVKSTNTQIIKQQEQRRLHRLRKNKINQATSIRKRKINNSGGIHGYTTENSDHAHSFTILPNNNVIIHLAKHPKTDKISHTHKYIGKYPNGYIVEEQSSCFPNCKEKYGYSGVGQHAHTIQTEDLLPEDIIKGNILKVNQKEKTLLLNNLNIIENILKRKETKIDLNDKKFLDFSLSLLIGSNQIDSLSSLIYKVGLPATKSSIKLLKNLVVSKKHQALIEFEFKQISTISINNLLKLTIEERKLEHTRIIITYIIAKYLYVYLHNYKTNPKDNKSHQRKNRNY